MESLIIFGVVGLVLNKISQWKEDRARQAALRKVANTRFEEYQREDYQETNDILALNIESLEELNQQGNMLPYVGEFDFVFGPNNENDHHNLVDTYSPPTVVPDHYELV
jgi:hypothetical protein